MAIKTATLAKGSFIRGDDGKYVATVLATTHQLGNAVHLTKVVHLNDDYTLENAICAYRVETNGDLKVIVDEPTTLRITIANDA